MNRAALLGMVLLWGCSQRTGPPPTNFSGTYDLALFPDMLMFNSADRNELRALDLIPTPRDFIRAPNPLEPLSIPVAPRPFGLTRDLNYDGGEEATGPYVYAYSSGGTAISVVSADRSVLKEVSRFSTAGAVTAMTARGPDSTHPDSTLFYATVSYSAGSGDGGTAPDGGLTLPAATAGLFSVDVPGLTLDPSGQPQLGTLVPTPIPLAGLNLGSGELIASLLILPSGPQVGKLAIATKIVGAPGSGRALLYDPVALSPPKTLNFSFQRPDAGSVPVPVPVVRLKTHPAYPDPAGGPIIPECTRIFGLVDPEGCAAIPGCSQGLLAVDLSAAVTGAPPAYPVALDATGQTMQTLRIGNGLPLDFWLAPGTVVVVPSGSALSAVGYNLLGLGTSSDGTVVFFDGSGLRNIDGNGNPPAVDPPQAFLPLGPPQTPAPGTGPLPTPPANTILVSANVTQDETIQIVDQGVIPGLENEPRPSTGATFQVATGLATRVMPNDFIELPECLVELRVTSVDAGTNALFAAPPIPSTCAPLWTFFAVRAGALGSQYVVQGTSSGYLGRIGPNETIDLPLPNYYRPDGFPNPPVLAFTFGAEDPQAVRDFRYELNLHANYAPLFFQPDPAVCPSCTLPGAVVHRVNDPTAFVAYPSASAVVEFSPASILPNQLNRNLKYYH